MRQSKFTSGGGIVKNIIRKARKWYSAEEIIRVVLHCLRCEETIAELFRPLAARPL